MKLRVPNQSFTGYLFEHLEEIEALISAGVAQDLICQQLNHLGHTASLGTFRKSLARARQKWAAMSLAQVKTDQRNQFGLLKREALGWSLPGHSARNMLSKLAQFNLTNDDVEEITALAEKIGARPAQALEAIKCPVCGAAELIQDTCDLPYTYKVETTVIPAVTGDFCNACGESIIGTNETERVMREMLAFNKQVDAATVDPAFIVAVRKKLDLDQNEATEIFGGGIGAFSRYENGKTKPSLALVMLLKLLDRHPGLLNEIKATN